MPREHFMVVEKVLQNGRGTTLSGIEEKNKHRYYFQTMNNRVSNQFPPVTVLSFNFDKSGDQFC